MPKFTKEDRVLGTITRVSNDPREIHDLKFRQGFKEVKSTKSGGGSGSSEKSTQSSK